MKLYRELRAQMVRSDVDTAWLAKKLNLSRQSLSLRLNNKVAWRVDEMYRILDLLDLPHSALAECFPKDGI